MLLLIRKKTRWHVSNRLLKLFSLLMVLTVSACSFLSFKKDEPTPEATPSGMDRYYGQGMSIMLPTSYRERDVQEDLPTAIETIKNISGGDDGLLSGLLNNIDKNVVWWGWDSETIEENPLYLLIVKNKALNALPLTATAIGLERVLTSEGAYVEQSSLHLGGRAMVRFKFVKDEIAWIAYAFKEQGYLWLSVFVFTPEGLIGAQKSFEISMGTITIDPVQSEGQ